MSATNYPIDNIINVNIVQETVVPSLEDFGLFCLMTDNIAVIPTSERYRLYSNISGVLTDFGATSPEYYAARSFFSQQPKPIEFMIASVDLGSETYVEGIQAALLLNKFYGLGVTDLLLTDADLLEIAQYVQTQLMLFFYQVSASDIPTNVTTDIASQFQALSLDRSVLCFYEATNTTTRLDLAYAGMGFTQQPGTFNWANKTLIGILPTTISPSNNIDYALKKGVNLCVQLIQGLAVTRTGNTSGALSGIEWIDVRTGIDYMQIALQQEILQLLVASPKIPDTDSGYAAIAGVITNVLTNCISLGILSSLPAPVVTYPSLVNVPVAQRQARIAGPFNFTARLAGAINFITINGTLTV
ncbi:DUF3383 family protein [bacterium]|nr:DUF3383 family protein [bacterium]